MAFTFFFRDHHTLDLVASHFIALTSGYKSLKIWDAGCAMGPEPYTFAIILAEKMGFYAYRNLSIYATDIDETENFGKTIQDGIYPKSELSRMPPNIFEKYFRQTDREGYYMIDDNVKARLKFQQHDLLSLKPVDTGFQLVICKNVLLHFQPDQRIEVMKMYHSVLTENGLFVTEQTQTMPVELSGYFEKITTDANIYRKISR
jgi:chemotaxis protein methyltransferase CheR